MTRFTLILAHVFAVATVAAPAQTVSAYAPSVNADEVAARIAAATPAPCPMPLPDTLVGTAGVQPVCMTRPDATRQTLIQSSTVVTAADGSFAGTWPAPFVGPPTGRIADIEISSSNSAPFTCAFLSGSVTSTSFAGRCYQIVASTLPTTATALLGLVVSPLNNAAGGLTVRVTGRQ